MRKNTDAQHEIKQGDFVVSLSGRDRGRTFIVIEVCGDEFVLICDGKLRKVEKPKKKKIKHVSYAGGKTPDTGALTNRKAAAEIKRFCEPY